MNTCRTTTILTISASLLALSLAPAAAFPGFGDRDGRGGPDGRDGGSFAMLQGFDLNKDDIISEKEFAKGLATRFQEIDSNNDKTLSLEEMKGHAAAMPRKKQAVRPFQRLDLDGNGQVDRTELSAVLQRFESGDKKRGWGRKSHGPRGEKSGFVHVVDANADGKISPQESKTFLDDVLKDGPLTLDSFSKLSARFSAPMVVRSFQHLDANGDLKVTFEEFETQHIAIAKKLDRDDDRELSRRDMRRGKRYMDRHDGRAERGGFFGRHGDNDDCGPKRGWRDDN
ncbi:EF-hand domain-containing protein [Polycladidibacter hongkongensis]|uniref:EF-hand domain-containing protein n=1 Tax=Polycladidibacter hongkongensis TaxID=1647556 RepID=UPI000829E553|nr:EF-hand domain-containing protein [Pseudovibrio hongkongensis]